MLMAVPRADGKMIADADLAARELPAVGADQAVRRHGQGQLLPLLGRQVRGRTRPGAIMTAAPHTMVQGTQTMVGTWFALLSSWAIVFVVHLRTLKDDVEETCS